MGNKMLIDAAHPEETRVVVLRGNRVEEFDFEAANKRQLRGNIYLAKVTRVEPSLQAAFIEYGGNRHGFLAFSEIHPDYYQIPVADRQQLLEDEARSAQDEDDENRPAGGHRRSRRHRRGGNGSAEKRAAPGDETVRSDEDVERAGEEHPDVSAEAEAVGLELAAPQAHELDLAPDEALELGDTPQAEGASAEAPDDEPVPAEIEGDAADDEHEHEGEAVEHVTTLEHGVEASLHPDEAEPPHEAEPDGEAEAAVEAADEHAADEGVEQLGGDALEDVPHRTARPRRHYKIQEVIKRRQVLLVQVVKEERGNKGAALTTYLSLAGRYSVLMPNTARGGGISRKIVDPEDRKRLKAIAQELEVPDGMGIILRTAGASRGIAEVKRDFEYLMRMWETVRETTLKSSAPTLVYEEGSLIKRSLRDLFTKDVDEVVVAGEEGYREAKDFMRLLMPNQLRNVIAYRESQPIFAKSGAEAQLDAMFSNQVILKSGGYLVINQTEALVAIDVNSGRSTREHNIEDTAVRTNLEAADEIARQLRLRDLAGLIVVDFIDMEEGRNDRAVERRLKDALKNDRARIQIGRISHFGLLEMSRQRMRTGVLEGSTVMCAHCAGSGNVRSVSSMALHVLRLLEDSLIRSAAYNLSVRTRAEVALYILNQKRANLLDLESRFGVSVTVLSDPAMTGMVYHAVERGSEATPPQVLAFRPGAAAPETAEVEEDESEAAFEEADVLSDGEEGEDEIAGAPPAERRPREDARGGAPDAEGGRRRRRRRRRRGRDGQPNGLHAGATDEAGASGEDDGTDRDPEELTDIEAGFLPEAAEPEAAEPEAAEGETELLPAEAASEEASAADDEPEAEAADTPRRRKPRRPRGAVAADAPVAEATATAEEPAPARRARRGRARTADLPLELESEAPPAQGEAIAGLDTQPPAEPELPLAAAPTEPAREEAPVPARAAKPAPLPAAEPDPDRPKRSGWWQRAKATFTAGS